MISRIIIAILFFLLLLFFAISSQSIVSVKMEELRFNILKDQLMNYELSGVALREKFKSMFLDKEDTVNEIKLNILESSIMNSNMQVIEEELSTFDKVGLEIVNIVRRLSFKSSLNLLEDQKNVSLLQFAFYLERTKKYNSAIAKYNQLEDQFSGSGSEEYAFVLLHNGFCLAMTGERASARVKLEKVIDLYPGSHYSDNAEILLKILEDGERRETEFKSVERSPLELAELYFQNGKYKDSLEILEKLENLSENFQYIKARDLEETGNVAGAITIYLDLVKQRNDLEVAKKANRRLLIIGNFYQKNEKISNFAKAQAVKLGDKEVVKSVEEGESLMLSSNILEKTKTLDAEANKEIIQEIESVKKEIEINESKVEEVALVKEVEKETKIEPPPVKEEVKPEPKLPPKPEEPNYEALESGKIGVSLVDGRKVSGEKIEFSDPNNLILGLGSFTIKLPVALVEKFVSNEKNKEIGIVTSKNKAVFGVEVVPGLDEGEWLVKKNDGSETKINFSEWKKVIAR